MKNIKYISASAGSGKTYRLTEELTKAIQSNAVQPENVILTTFTKAAAAEFKEKAKAMLYEHGMVEAADRLDQALIGTIHSVAESFILKYWYVLGLSPNINAIAEEDLEFFKNQSLVTLLSYDDLNFLSDFAEEFNITQFMSSKINYDFWKGDLSKILELAANYDITNLEESRAKSKAQAESFKKKGCHIKIEKDLLEKLLDLALKLNRATDDPDAKEKLKVEINNQKRELQKNKNTSLKYAKSLKKFLGTLKFNDDEFIEAKNKILSSLNDIYASQEVISLITRYIDLMFDLAEKWMNIYEEYKTKNHLIDFSDMEKKFCELLQDKEVVADIKATYKYVFVDEFQDCSPKQVRIFDVLSDIVEHSIWVGDKKQAIYGFRGSDTELTTAVMDIIKDNKERGLDGCTTDILHDSWRSLPAIVDFTNEVFVKVFNKKTQKEQDEVRLTSQRKGEEVGEGHTAFWWLPDSKKENRIAQLSANIVAMVNNNIPPEDIAVLARTNYDLEQIAEALREYGLPVFIDEGEQAQSNTVSLVTSLLQIIADPTAELPKAQVAFLTLPDYKLGKILDDKLEFRQKAKEDDVFYDDIPLVKKVMQERERYLLQSISSMVQSLIIELDLFNTACQLNDSVDTAKLLHAVIDTATEYEEHCALMNLPSSVTGFLAYIGQNNISISGSQKGIQLFTYHRSKGLEWKNVIVWGCDKKIKDNSDIVKHNMLGVKLIKMSQSRKENLYPEVWISVLPYIFTGRSNVADEWLSKISGTDVYKCLEQKEIEETKRLMYVAMTRPRDNLIIALCGRRGAPLPLQLFTDFGITVANDFLEGPSDLFKAGVVSEKWDNAELEIEYKHDAKGPVVLDIATRGEPAKDVPLRDITPSSMEGGDVQAQLIDCGAPITVTGSYESDALGTCIHDIFCVTDSKSDQEVAQMVKAYGFEKNLPECGQIKAAWGALTGWLSANFGPAQKQYHELPFKHQWSTAQIVTGSMDFVWETADGCIVVDYKTFPGQKQDLLDKSSKYYVGKYKGQLDCYEKALVAAGKNVLGKYLYYPMVGVLVKM